MLLRGIISSLSKDTLTDLHRYLQALEREGQLAKISAEVDPDLEIAEIHRRVISASGPALLFERVHGSAFPVVTNLFGSAERIQLAFGEHPKRLVEQVARAPETLLPPSPVRLWQSRQLLGAGLKLGTRSRRRGPVIVNRIDPPDLNRLPLTTSWPEDGGAFVTLPLVYTEDPETRQHNLGMYRIQRHDPTRTGVHWQIGKGGGFHFHKAEAAGKSLPMSLFIGGPAALVLAAVAPLPENVPELLLASAVLGERLEMTPSPAGHPHPIISRAEFAIQGFVPPRERLPEGPFGDHYGYYSLQHDYPVFQVQDIYHRDGAIFPATVVGKPRQEDFFIGDYLQELLSPLFPLVMPGVEDIWSYGETGYHSLGAAVLRERYGREAMSSAFRILGEGQLSLTKFLIALDHPVDLRSFRAVLQHALERVDWSRDLYVFPDLSMDTLDYCGPEVNKGSKGILLGMGEVCRQLPPEFCGELPGGVDAVEVYCPGCLVVQGHTFAGERDQAQRIAAWKDFESFPLLILVDRSSEAVRSDARFLWTVFTRFEPAADIHAASTRLERHNIIYTGPVCIDARLKPGYPPELFCDSRTASKVGRRWLEYFPGRDVEMGDSDSGNLDSM